MLEERNPILSPARNSLGVPVLRNRVLFMLGLPAVWRMGAVVSLKAAWQLDHFAR